jgi:hypothetical protein
MVTSVPVAAGSKVTSTSISSPAGQSACRQEEATRRPGSHTLTRPISNPSPLSSS